MSGSQTPGHPGDEVREKSPRDPKERRDETLTDEQRRESPELGRSGAAEATPGSSIAAGRAAATPDESAPPPARSDRGNIRGAMLFLAPAAAVLLVMLVYPTVFTIWRSFFGSQAANAEFVGFDNYVRMFTVGNVFTALKNNLYWVIIAPTLVTALGLVFAVLMERVRFSSAFKAVVFMPMAISFLAVGIIFRLVYQADPDVGLANALTRAVLQLFDEPGQYAGASPSVDDVVVPTGDGGFITDAAFDPGAQVTLGLIGIPRQQLPQEAVDAAAPPAAGPDELSGTVWFDFSIEGERGDIDPGEQALPGVAIDVVSTDGTVVAEAVTDLDGTFAVAGLDPGDYRVRLADSNFDLPFAGINWLSEEFFLGASVATWAIISAFIWMWAGFAMVLIAAGLAAIPREVMESARVDGASEWQVFRRIMVPLLAPVLLVVLVTLMINVLKIFDLVLIMAPGPVQDDATVLALEMWRVSFGAARDFGLGSAITVVLFLLVIPAMLFNLRRFRREEA